jgi:hypothetical protein
MQPELERLPYWHEASGIVREACRVPAEITVLSPVLTFFALILGLLMQLGATQSMLGPFRRMLGKLVLDAEGQVIGMAGMAVPPCAANLEDGAVIPACADPPRAGPARQTRKLKHPLHHHARGPRTLGHRPARVPCAARDVAPPPSNFGRTKTGPAASQTHAHLVSLS